jgi:hypothetical protein
MRPNGPTTRLGDFPLAMSDNPNPAVRFALYAKRNGAQVPGQYWLDRRPAPTPDVFVGRAHAKSKYAGAGRTNGLPWDTTSPCTVSTVPDNGPKRASQPARLDQKIESAWQAGNWSVVCMSLMSLRRAVIDPELRADISMLFDVAFARAREEA